MAISIDKVDLSKSAPVGTTVGTLTLSDTDGTVRNANWVLTPDSAGLFKMADNKMVTLRTPIAPGYYAVAVRGVAQFVAKEGTAYFVIAVS